MKNIFKTPGKAAFLLFIIALSVRLSILLFFDDNRITPDGVGYHHIAVNIVKGNGLSKREEEPFEKYYFREPGYPVFLAGIYSVVNLFHPVQYIDDRNRDTAQLGKHYPEIVAAKAAQVVLDSFSIVLLYFIILKVSYIKLAFATSLLTAIFLNLAFHSIYILRESLIVFLLLLLNGAYLEYIFNKNRYFWLMVMGVIVGALIMIFQVHVAIIPVFLLLILILTRSVKTAIVHTSYITIIVLLFTLPYSFNVYQNYPDYRIFKTFGCSFTYELVEYTSAIHKLVYYGVLTEGEGMDLQDWGNDGVDQFDKSFNGYYQDKADYFNSLVPESLVSERVVKNVFGNFIRSVFLTRIGYEGGYDLIKKHGFMVLIPLVFIPALIGVIGIIGIVMYWRKYLIYFFPFLFYLSVFWILGSEYRRMIILQPFLIFFGLLFINRILVSNGVSIMEHNEARDYNKMDPTMVIIKGGMLCIVITFVGC